MISMKWILKCFFTCLLLLLMYLLSLFWQSRAHPREIMTEVLKALQELNVCWKKIGHYNMKCRWIPGVLGHHEGMINNPVHSNNYFGDESTIIENDGVTRSPNVVKFEVQVICHSLLFLPESWVLCACMCVIIGYALAYERSFS